MGSDTTASLAVAGPPVVGEDSAPPPGRAILSIIIVNWNTRDLLMQCLRSIAADCRSSYPGSVRQPGLRELPARPVEVFVVDNASSDESAQMVRESFPWVHMIENAENVGFARANNQAIEASNGAYVLLLNSDTEVLSDALATLIGYLDTHPKAAAVGPRLLNADGSLQPSCHPMLTPWREFWRLVFLDRIVHKATYGATMWDSPVPQPVEVIKGACLLLRREALNQVGLLDESYFMYTEEVDLCYRLAQAGWELWWMPQAEVIHYGEASSRQAAQAMYLQLYRSKIQFYRKFGGAARADHFKRLLRLAYGPRLIIARVGAPFSSALADRARTYGRFLATLYEM